MKKILVTLLFVLSGCNNYDDSCVFSRDIVDIWWHPKISSDSQDEYDKYIAPSVGNEVLCLILSTTNNGLYTYDPDTNDITSLYYWEEKEENEYEIGSVAKIFFEKRDDPYEPYDVTLESTDILNVKISGTIYICPEGERPLLWEF